MPTTNMPLKMPHVKCPITQYESMWEECQYIYAIYEVTVINDVATITVHT